MSWIRNLKAGDQVLVWFPGGKLEKAEVTRVYNGHVYVGKDQYAFEDAFERYGKLGKKRKLIPYDEVAYSTQQGRIKLLGLRKKMGEMAVELQSLSGEKLELAIKTIEETVDRLEAIVEVANRQTS